MNPTPFFVGYLATPRPLRPFHRLIAALLLAWLLCAGLTFAAFQADAGPSTWASESIEMTGTFRCFEGVALIHAIDDPTDAFLLVSPNKVALGAPWCGPPVAAGPSPGGLGVDPALNGSTVTIRGTTLERTGIRMIEVASIVPVVAVPPLPMSSPPPLSGGLVALTGEVVDSKCFLGAMKPGTGSTHRACAALCLAGGIPAGLVTGETPPNFFVLTGNLPDNGAALVGETVTFSGEVVAFGTIRILIIDADDARP